ncbi:hypothetical protein CMT52_12975 [Elizabethkingia anophelis]|nr:hypothetical protein [Elizabethkingia anophelis]
MQYRNKIDILSHEGIEVEAGSLWAKDNETMVLEDRDQYASFPYKEEIFTHIETVCHQYNIVIYNITDVVQMLEQLKEHIASWSVVSNNTIDMKFYFRSSADLDLLYELLEGYGYISSLTKDF